MKDKEEAEAKSISDFNAKRTPAQHPTERIPIPDSAKPMIDPAPAEDPSDIQNRILEREEIEKYDSASHPNRSIQLFKGNCF